MSKRRVSVDTNDNASIRRLANPFHGLDLSVLRSYRGELQSLARAAQNETDRLASLLVMVSQAIVLQESERQNTLVISDHAVLRWLERFGGVSTMHARSEIIAMVERGAAEVAVRDGMVVTVLPEGCMSAESLADEAAGS